MADLGFAPDGDLHALAHQRIASGALPVNTSGGGGRGGGPAWRGRGVTQLRGAAGARQVAGARIAAVAGYGMVEYRHGMCANAVVLEGTL